jgi:hypothetical protein
VEFGATDLGSPNEAVKKPLFKIKDTLAPIDVVDSKRRKLKAEIKAERSLASLRSSLFSNTRAAIDPFLADPMTKTKERTKVIPGFKRKRDVDDGGVHDITPALVHGTGVAEQKKPHGVATSSTERPPPSARPIPLVDYDSD